MASATQKQSSRIQAKFVLEHGEHGAVVQYTTHDTVRGHVEIQVSADTPIGDILLALEGQTTTLVINNVVNRGPASGRTTGQHQFLNLEQQVDVIGFFGSDDCIARPLQTYKIPFTFTIPERLLPQSCIHEVDDDEVRNEHLCLPPTSGSQAEQPNQTGTRVMYCISVQILCQLEKASAGSSSVSRFYRSMPIRVMPTVQSSNLSLQLTHSACSRTEHYLGKGTKSSNSGAIVIEASNTSQLSLPHPRQNRTESDLTTTINLNLRFDPPAGATETSLPSLAEIEALVELHSYHGSKPYRCLPDTRDLKSRLRNSSSFFHGFYSSRIKTALVRFGDNFQWDRNGPQLPESEVMIFPPSYGIVSPSAAYDSKSAFYTTAISVPLSLSADDAEKMSKEGGIVPTFHTCLASRVYQVKLTATFRQKQGARRASFSGSNPQSITTSIVVPLRVGATGSSTVPQNVGHPDDSVEREIDQAFFVPRNEIGHGGTAPDQRTSGSPPPFDADNDHADPGHGADATNSYQQQEQPQHQELPYPLTRTQSSPLPPPPPAAAESELPHYNPDITASRRASQPIQTRYEVPQQEWMHVGKIFSWTYKKIDAKLEKRRNSKLP